MWTSLKSKQTSNLHESCKLGVESIIREALVKKSVDNVTAILIVFEPVEKMITEQNSKDGKNLDINMRLKSGVLSERIPTEDRGVERTSLPVIIGEKNTRVDKLAKNSEDKKSNIQLTLPNEFRPTALLPNIIRHKSQPLIEESKLKRKPSFQETPRTSKMI